MQRSIITLSQKLALVNMISATALISVIFLYCLPQLPLWNALPFLFALKNTKGQCISRGWPIYGTGPSQILLSPCYIFVIFFRSFCATNFHSRWRVGYVFSGQIVPSSYIYVRGESSLLVEARLFPDIQRAGGKEASACNSLYTDVVLFFFSFFSKTSTSARKKNKERLFSFSLTPIPTR